MMVWLMNHQEGSWKRYKYYYKWYYAFIRTTNGNKGTISKILSFYRL